MKTSYQIKITLLVCTLLALFFFVQQIVWTSINDKEINLIRDLSYQLIYFYVWGIIFYFITILAEKYRLEKNTLLKYLPVHLVFGVLFAFLHRIFTTLAYLLIFSPDKLSSNVFPGPLFNKIIIGAFDSFLAYFFILSIYYGIDYYGHYRQHKLKSAELEKQLLTSQLQALKMQLQPHFLFNTLHAISTLMEEDIRAARKMLTKLSDLLRQTLEAIGVQEVALKNEMDFVKGYLEIEQTRFHDRLSIEYHIDETLLNALVPNLLLQPIVENSIKHGISNSSVGGKVIINVNKSGDNLVLEVCDNGAGSEQINIKEGIGLRNTRERLQRLYPDIHSFNIINSTDQGFCVVIKIPYKSISG